MSLRGLSEHAEGIRSEWSEDNRRHTVYSPDFVALHTHHANVQVAERRMALRRAAEERDSGDVGASPERAAPRRHHTPRAPRLALR